MSFFKRLIYYSFGFLIGAIILSFIFSGKKTTCNYSPNDRVIADISKKSLTGNFKINETDFIDSTRFFKFIKSAKVNFSQSDTKVDSCKIYTVSGYENGINKNLKLKNCKRNIIILEFNNIN